MIEFELMEQGYFDENALRESPIPIAPIKYKGKRFYYHVRGDSTGIIHPDDVSIFPSWTTVIAEIAPTSIYLKQWMANLGWDKAMQEMNERAAYGTAMHAINSRFLLVGQGTSKNDLLQVVAELPPDVQNIFKDEWLDGLRDDLLAFAQFVRDRNFHPLAIEIQLLDRAYGVAGTPDIIGSMDFDKKRITALLDMKSGRKGFYFTHELQLIAYWHMFEENFPDIKIDGIFNWSPKDWRKVPNYNLKNQTSCVPYPNKFLRSYMYIYKNKFQQDVFPENMQMRDYASAELKPGDATGDFYRQDSMNVILAEKLTKANERRDNVQD